MENILSTINNVFGFWDSENNSQISNIQCIQIKLWAKSILFFNPESSIWIFTKRNVIPPNLIVLKDVHIIYFNDVKDILNGTPLENYKIPDRICKPELSDIVRLSLLYKYSGSWIDIDDICVRKIPDNKNAIGCFLWENKKTATYWGSTFNLVEGSVISSEFKNFNFHIQNDPMIKWEKGNMFLHEWMEKIKTYKSSDWGQKIPTNMILNDNNIVKRFDVNLVTQHSMLLHPAFGNNAEFGNANCKGPMFPLYDLRISGLINYDSVMDEQQFWAMAKQCIEMHSFFIVKNSKNIGIIQNNENKKKWFIGHLANIDNIHVILEKFKNLCITNEY